MNTRTQEHQETYCLNTFDDKNYPLSLIVLGVLALVFLVVSIFSFFLKFWKTATIAFSIVLILVFVIIFCSKEYRLDRKKKKKEEADNEKKIQ